MVKIRDAVIADKEKITEFQLAMAMETENLVLDKYVVDLGVEAVFRDPSKGQYFVAESGGQVVGSLLITFEWSDWRNGQIIWIQSVYVDEEHRGKGVFKMLYEFIKSKVLNEDNGYRGIRLYVDKTNEPARKVYEKLGMENHHYETYEWMRQ